MEVYDGGKKQKNIMKAEVFRLSRKGWKWIAFPAIFFWIAAVCFGLFALDGAFQIHQQNTEAVVAEASVLNRDIDFTSVEGILDWTEVYEISGNLQIAGYFQECTIVGIKDSFILENMKQGSMYPQESAMPYLVVNEAFLKEMKDSSGNRIEDNMQIDWLTKTVELTYDDNLKIVCKICGIMESAEENKEPEIYMSVASAKMLMRFQENGSEEKSVRLRIKNIQMYETVRKALNRLQVYPEDLEEEILWSGKIRKIQTELLYLCALLSGISACVILHQSLKIDFMRNEKEYQHIKTIDTSLADFHKQINQHRKICFFLTGGVIGWGIYACWPVLLAMMNIS